MSHTRHIAFTDDAHRADAQDYEEALPGLSLSMKLSDCQRFSEEGGEANLAKVVILFLEGGDEIRHEVRRIFSWQYRHAKAAFLVAQLSSDDRGVVLCAIDLLGVLRWPAAIPDLDGRFDAEEAEVARHIVSALGQMEVPLALRTILRALKARDRGVLLEALRQLSRRTGSVPWTVFRALLRHGDAEVRIEAAFAISIRRARRSGAPLLKAIAREGDAATRRRMIRFLGGVPRRRLAVPLLGIIVGDRDQKARLEASRALDRLQGALGPNALYRLRRTRDVAMRAEVLFRLGKFGSSSVKHKAYLRKMLARSADPHLLQACLLALGHIAERRDADLLIGSLSPDPVVAYSAAIALTKILRLEDADRLLRLLGDTPFPIIRQVFLRYLGRRRGFGASPEALLQAVRSAIEADANLNTRYLAYGVLEYAPSEATVEFLSSSGGGAFEREAIDRALGRIVAGHGEIVLAFLGSGGPRVWEALLPHLPGNLQPSWYRPLAVAFFDRYGGRQAEGEVDHLCQAIVKHFIAVPAALREFLAVAPDASWRELLLRLLVEHAGREEISPLEGELLRLLGDEAPEVRSLAMMLVLSLREASIVPHLIEIAESDPREELRRTARHIARALVGEGVV